MLNIQLNQGDETGLLGAAPCTAMVFVWSTLTKGNPAYTVVQVASNDIIILFAFVPIVIFLLGVSNVSVPFQMLFMSVVLFVLIPLAAVCAVLLLGTGTNTKLKGDAAIAMLSVGSMAVGYLILNVFSVSSNVSGDVCSTLFGSTSILTLTGSEVVMCVIASLVVVAFFIIFYNRIFSVTFDENFTRSWAKILMYTIL